MVMHCIIYLSCRSITIFSRSLTVITLHDIVWLIDTQNLDCEDSEADDSLINQVATGNTLVCGFKHTN